MGTAQTVKQPPQQPAQPQYANYWAPLTRKGHTMPHPAQPQHTNHWAPRTRKRHRQERRPQRPTESSNSTQHAKRRTGDCPGPRKETTTRRNVTRGGGGDLVGCALFVGNLAFQIGGQVSHAKSRGFLPCPPIPLCFACSMSHSLVFASAKFPTVKSTRHHTPPPL